MFELGTSLWFIPALTQIPTSDFIRTDRTPTPTFLWSVEKSAGVNIFTQISRSHFTFTVSGLDSVNVNEPLLQRDFKFDSASHKKELMLLLLYSK